MPGLADILAPIMRMGLLGKKVPSEDGTTSNNNGDPYTDERAILADVREVKDASMRARAIEEPFWELSWEFYEGRHWVRWDGSRIVRLDLEDKPRITKNYVNLFVQTRLANLLSAHPEWVGVPSKDTESARDAARVGEDVWKAYWRRLEMDDKAVLTVIYLLISGNAFWKVCWDPQAGKSVRVPGQKTKLDPDTGAPVLNPDGSPAMEMDEVPIGDLAIEVVAPHEILPDPAAADLRDAQKVLHRVYRPIALVKEQYPDKAEQIKAVDPSLDSGGGSFRAAWPMFGMDAKSGEKIELIEAWYRPTEKYPKGLRAVIAGNVILEAGPTPPGYDYIPFVHFRELRRRAFWASATTRYLLDLNKIINLQASQREYRRQRQRPHFIAPIEAGIAEEDLNDDDKSLILYNAPHAPSYSSPASEPASYIEGEKSLLQEMKDLSGQNDILSGDVPGEVRSGRMAAFLHSYAQKGLAPVAAELERGFSRAATLAMPLLRHYVTEDRFLTTVGANRGTEVLHFKGEALSEVDSIVVRSGSMTPVAKEYLLDKVPEWIQNGIIPREKGLELLDVASFDSLFRPNLQDRDNANEENYAFLRLTDADVTKAHQGAIQKSMPPPDHNPGGLIMAPDPRWTLEEMLRSVNLEAHDFENHVVHLERLDEGLRKTKAYKKMTPAVRALVDAHADMHKAFLAGVGPAMMRPPPPSPMGGLPGGPPGAPGGAPQGGGPMPAEGPGVEAASAQEGAQGMAPAPPAPLPNAGVPQ